MPSAPGPFGTPAGPSLFGGISWASPVVDSCSETLSSIAPLRDVDPLPTRRVPARAYHNNRASLRLPGAEQLVHLISELTQLVLGVGRFRELVGGEQCANLQRALSTVLHELAAQLRDSVEQRLQVA